jgi:hypothetical protein
MRGLQPFPLKSNGECPRDDAEMAVASCVAHVLIGEPVSTSPEHALGFSHCECAFACRFAGRKFLF